MSRISTRTNVYPEKVYIKDMANWKGKSVNIVLSRNGALHLAEGLVKAAQNTSKLDIAVYPKKKRPHITVTYWK